MYSLKTTVVSGFKWVALSRILQRLLAIVAMAILARRLEPSAFGIFTLAFVAIDGMQLFQTLGLNTAIIRQKELSERAKHTAFALILLTGVAISAVCYLVAPQMGEFFKNDAVTPVLRALGVVFILGSFSRVPNALLTRQLRYRTLTTIEFIGSALNSVMMIALVFVWPSVWALVVAYLVKQVVVTGAALQQSGYRPRLIYDRASARELLGFGGYMILVGILTYIWRSVDTVFVGRVLGTTLLGYFALAASVGDMANRYFTWIVAETMFPVFARLQSDKERLKAAFLKSTRVVAVVTIPFGVILICLADPLVLTLYGPKWTATIPLIRIFGVTSLLISLTAGVQPILRACGYPEREMYILIARLVVRIPLLLVLSARFGLMGAVSTGLITVMLSIPPLLLVLRRIMPFGIREYLTQFASVGFASAVMGGAIFASRAALGFDPRLVLDSAPATAVVFSTIGGLAFLGSIMLVDRALLLELLSMGLGKERVDTLISRLRPSRTASED